MTASARRADQAAALRQLGAHEVTVGDDIPASPKYDVVIESVGGRTLGTALAALERGGVCVTLGVSASAEVTFDTRTFFVTGRATLYGFYLFTELGNEPAAMGLRRLADLVAAGQLAPHISVERPWNEIAQVARGPDGPALSGQGGADRGVIETFAALAGRNYRFYWIGLVFYVLGHRAEYVTFAWLTWEVTHDPLSLGYLGLAQGCRSASSSSAAASWPTARSASPAARHAVPHRARPDRRLRPDGAGVARFQHLLVLAVLTNTFRAFDEPSRLSLIPQLVDRRTCRTRSRSAPSPGKRAG